MKNKYILVLGLLQLVAVSYSFLVTYAAHHFVSNISLVDLGRPIPSGFYQAAEFSKYGFILYLLVILWVIFASLLEEDRLRFHPSSSMIAISGCLLLFGFAASGIWFTLLAWTPLITLHIS